MNWKLKFLGKVSDIAINSFNSSSSTNPSKTWIGKFSNVWIATSVIIEKNGAAPLIPSQIDISFLFKLSISKEKKSPLPKKPFTFNKLSIANPYLLESGLIPPVRIYPTPGSLDKPIGNILLNFSR